MIILNETQKFRKDNDEYENNIEKTRIYKNKEEILPFCILSVNKNVITIKQSMMITQTGTDDPRVKEVIEAIKAPQPKPKTKPKSETKPNEEKRKEEDKPEKKSTTKKTSTKKKP